MKNFWLMPLGLICGTLIGNIVKVTLLSWIAFFLSIILIGILIRVIGDILQKDNKDDK